MVLRINKRCYTLWRVVEDCQGLLMCLEGCHRQLNGLNRTWGSADLSAWRTFGRPKSGLIRRPPFFQPKKQAESPAGLSVGQSAGRNSGLFLPHPLVLVPPSSNTPPPPRILITRLLLWP